MSLVIWNWRGIYSCIMTMEVFKVVVKQGGGCRTAASKQVCNQANEESSRYSVLRNILAILSTIRKKRVVKNCISKVLKHIGASGPAV